LEARLTPYKSGVIDIISATPNQPDSNQCAQNGTCHGGCDPTNLEPFTPARELKGYMLHNQHNGFFQFFGRFPILTFGEPQLPEVPLADAGDADSVELANLTGQCDNIRAHGFGGKGICRCTAP
jgi:hypothetical protein